MSQPKSSNISSATPKANRKKTESAPNSRTFISLGLAAVVLGTFLSVSLNSSGRRVVLHTPNQRINSSVVDTDELRRQGLSERIGLGKNDSMLFVFDQGGYHGFWMKGMKFPIDIVWLDADKRVITIKERAGLDSYPDVFYPTSPAKYVLELVEGRAGELGITENTTLSW